MADDRHYIHDATIRHILKSQYHASLAMLEECIVSCPEDLWSDPTPRNAYWQVAYHTLYFTDLYLRPNEAAFRPWRHHQADVQHPDGIAGPPDPNSALPLVPQEYSRNEVLEYWRLCDSMVDAAVDALDLHSEESGFSWYPLSKLEHQFINIRHVQHHSAQLADRLRAKAGSGVSWVSARPPGG